MKNLIFENPFSQSLATEYFFDFLVEMASRSKKSTTRGPSSSTRSNIITKRHFNLPNDDVPFVQDMRSRNIIVEHQVDISHVAPF
ncbi:hypothetical protein PJP10_31545, partial [Mycobacterium kansasii]